MVPGAPPDPAATTAFQDRFASELLKDVIPFVERSYRALPGSRNRAIAGLSMGGGQTLRVVSTNPDQFADVAVWSMGVNPATTADFEKRNAPFLDHPTKVNGAVSLFEVTCGEKDTLAFAGSQNLAELLRRRGIKHAVIVTPGGHTWINWRRYLNDFASKLFQGKAR